MQIDGWYIVATFAIECDSQLAYTTYRPQQSGGCRDRYETKQIGTAKRGYPVWEKTTMFDPNGAESFSSISEVVEFSHAALDASLFEVPQGYREVKDFASAFSTGSTNDTGNTSNNESRESTPSSTTQTPNSNTETPSSNNERPKSPSNLRKLRLPRPW
jgi:hypothetical protein